MDNLKIETPRRKRTALTQPVSIRFTRDELAELKTKAGRLSVSDYVRRRLFAENAAAPASSETDHGRLSPQARQKLLVQILAKLSKLDGVKNVNLLMEALQSGLMDASPEAINALKALHQEIQAVRRDLLKALGLRP